MRAILAAPFMGSAVRKYPSPETSAVVSSKSAATSFRKKRRISSFVVFGTENEKTELAVRDVELLLETVSQNTGLGYLGGHTGGGGQRRKALDGVYAQS